MRQARLWDGGRSLGRLDCTIHSTLQRSHQVVPGFLVRETNRVLRIVGALTLVLSAGMSAGTGLGAADQLASSRMI